MARWEDLLKMDPDRQVRVNELYADRFPRDIRQCLSAWIESQDWNSAAENAVMASTCFQGLLVCLDQQMNNSASSRSVLEGPNYEWFKYFLQKHFGNQPQTLAAFLSECLREEDKILSLDGGEQVPVQQPAQQQHPLDKQIEDLMNKTLDVGKELKSLKDLREKLIYAQKNWQNQDPQNGMDQSEQVLKEELCKLTSFMTQNQENVLQHVADILRHSNQVANALIKEELPQWKQRQHMACVGCPTDTSLHHLQKWFTCVVGVLLEVQKLVDKLQAQQLDDAQISCFSKPIAEIKAFNVSLLTQVMSSALVVEKQPTMSTWPQRPLILKTGTRFSMAVRFLANLPEFKCVLKVQPVFDKDVEDDVRETGFRHFEFTVDGCKVLDTDSPDGGLVANFDPMSIEATKAGKGPSKSPVNSPENRSGPAKKKRLGVTEELHNIKFVCEFQHAGLKFDFETSSLPLVIVCNTIQIPSAWATIMWCSMLPPAALENLLVFAKPPQVPWTQLSEVLNWQFYTVGKKGLDRDQLSMLHNRIAGANTDMVKWNTFKRDQAWIWLDGILDLIKKHLVDLWSAGLIMGFVTKERTQHLLMEKPTGTFLLRFSESIKEGAISVSYVEQPNTGATAEVIHVDPFQKFELESQSLANVVYYYTVGVPGNLSKRPLVYLYPDIPKDSVFQRFFQDPGDCITNNGYVCRRNVPESRRSLPPPPPQQEMETELNALDLMEDLFGPEVCSHLAQTSFDVHTSTLTAQDLNLYAPV